MNPGIKFFVLFIFIFITTGTLFSQHNYRFTRGFIINNRGDTIDGFIYKKHDNSPLFSCTFKPTKSDNSTQFGPKELKGFGIYADNQFFIPISFPLGIRDTLGFLRILFDGTYDLLYYKMHGVRHFLTRGPDGVIHDIMYPSSFTDEEYLAGMTSNVKYQTAIASFLPQQALSIEVEPNIDSFLNYLKSFYNASAEPYIVYKGFKEDLYIGFVAGVSFDWYVVKTTGMGFQSFPGSSPYAGISLQSMNDYAIFGILFQSTFGYTTHHYSYETENLTSKNYYETFIESLASTSRIGFSFNPYTSGFLRPFVEGGGLVSVYINPKYDNYTDQLLISGNTDYSLYNQNVRKSELFYGAFLRTGLQMNLKNNSLIKFSGGYDFLTNSGSDRINSVDFSIIYTVKFK
jgi:hypothetical protein